MHAKGVWLPLVLRTAMSAPRKISGCQNGHAVFATTALCDQPKTRRTAKPLRHSLVRISRCSALQDGQARGHGELDAACRFGQSGQLAGSLGRAGGKQVVNLA